MMLDVKTLFVVMIATSLLLAASMAVAAGMQFRDGVGKWTGALALQAVSYVLLLGRGVWPDFISVIVANALIALVISVQAAAILEFYGRRLAILWHVIPPLVIVVLFAFLRESLAARVVVTGLGFGGGLLVSGLLLQRLDMGGKHPARLMVMAGFLAGAFAMFARAMAMILDPTLLKDFVSPSHFQGVTFMIALSIILVTSVGFLLMQKERAEEAARQLAVTDPLTGTFNRRTFLELGAREIARARRAKVPLSVLMLDLDHFKLVNDRHGHQGGDEALKCVVDLLQTCLRREDLLVRYGGEEFCVLLPDVTMVQAVLLAERVRNSIQGADFTYAGKSIPMTVSVGVAVLMRDSAEDIERLVSRADEALYSAKASGRNRVVVYPENATIALVSRSHQRAAGKDSAE